MLKNPIINNNIFNIKTENNNNSLAENNELIYKRFL